MMKGVDLSVWQGAIDFNKVKNDGIEFAILRTGYSQKIDKRFKQYVQGCLNAKIPVLGVYHFSYAMTEERAREEARFCAEQVKLSGLSTDTIIFFDFEYDTVDYAAKKGVILGKKECSAHTVAFCDEVRKLGYVAGIYFNTDYYKNMYEQDVIDSYVNWLADWSGVPNYECEFHQYTSEGKVDGIAGNVDMNYRYTPVEPNEITAEQQLDFVVGEVFKNKFGSGEERVKAMYIAGYNYAEVQERVNLVDKLAREVIEGDWADGENRIELLTRAGYPFHESIQDRVNGILEGLRDN